ncbi:Hypothetical protein A7982_10818 [Minicystis rosea]|nr:Hypothetical protein A7982_10818 [Minicystis rosea]
MNRYTLIALPALGLALSTAACTIREEVVQGPRPADRTEVITIRPSPRHVWVRGHWERSRGGWVWIAGRWERA